MPRPSISSMTGDPRYQRAVQKIMRMGKHQKAILSTVMADKKFASEGMRRGLKLMAMGATKADRDRRFKLKKTAVRTGIARRADAKGYTEKQNRTAEMLGLGNLVLSAHMGQENLRMDALREKRLLSLISRGG